MKTPPRYKLCRRLGDGVYVQCQTPKYQIAKSKKIGAKKFFRKPKTDYGIQLIEKQKVRFSYHINERQLSNYVKRALSASGETPTGVLFQSLELRLDNIVYRAGITLSRQQARQAVSHGHIAVNGKRVTIPSCHTRVGDVIAIRPRSLSSPLFHEVRNKIKNITLPAWLAVDNAGELTVKSMPSLEAGRDADLDYGSVIEFYNRV